MGYTGISQFSHYLHEYSICVRQTNNMLIIPQTLNYGHNLSINSYIDYPPKVQICELVVSFSLTMAYPHEKLQRKVRIPALRLYYGVLDPDAILFWRGIEYTITR